MIGGGKRQRVVVVKNFRWENITQSGAESARFSFAGFNARLDFSQRVDSGARRVSQKTGAWNIFRII
jgi:hypothetical protein